MRFVPETAGTPAACGVTAPPPRTGIITAVWFAAPAPDAGDDPDAAPETHRNRRVARIEIDFGTTVLPVAERRFTRAVGKPVIEPRPP
jgi:hypothetical protein